MLKNVPIDTCIQSCQNCTFNGELIGNMKLLSHCLGHASICEFFAMHILTLTMGVDVNILELSVNSIN